ncbi:uncharacterized protein J3D65DRAFT_36967 [Phyllosticta citribraziliensis]|uniref:Uncharacterized protein n=1 Tax=Phyllosticta citribraziliensis TaxID=989973 RepID=A0ABR1MA87_9PEZI
METTDWRMFCSYSRYRHHHERRNPRLRPFSSCKPLPMRSDGRPTCPVPLLLDNGNNGLLPFVCFAAWLTRTRRLQLRTWPDRLSWTVVSIKAYSQANASTPTHQLTSSQTPIVRPSILSPTTKVVAVLTTFQLVPMAAMQITGVKTNAHTSPTSAQPESKQFACPAACAARRGIAGQHKSSKSSAPESIISVQGAGDTTAAAHPALLCPVSRVARRRRYSDTQSDNPMRLRGCEANIPSDNHHQRMGEIRAYETTRNTIEYSIGA